MARTVKNILLALIALLAVLVAYRVITRQQSPAPLDHAVSEQPAIADDGPFKDLGVHYDGHYICERGNLRYLIRFFPEGRVVTVNGTREVEADLPKFLTRDTQGNPAMGLYNVNADVRGDSIFFVTRPEKGEISYRGKVTSDSTVQFFRHSHITGKDFDFTYVFRSDASVAAQQDAAQLGEMGDAVSGQ